MEELLELKIRIDNLTEEVEQLKTMVKNRTLKKNTTAHEIIANLIDNKVENEVHKDWNHCKAKIKRRITNDLKWDLHVRCANDFETEHIEQAKEFLSNYEIDEYYKFQKRSY